MATLLTISGIAFTGDTDAQLVAGDSPASFVTHKGRSVLRFDDTVEMAATSPEIPWPTTFGGGTLKAICHFYMASDNTNDIALDVFVEAKIPISSTVNMNTTASFDTANSGTLSLSGSTVGGALKLEITLTNDDSIAAGDSVRIGFRRDTDSANDDASGDLFLTSIEIQEV